jgi:hypothetical protein
MFPRSHGNILLFYKMEKKPGNNKESYLRIRSLLRFGNTLGCPSLRRTHLYGNLPYNYLFVEIAAQ